MIDAEVILIDGDSHHLLHLHEVDFARAISEEALPTASVFRSPCAKNMHRHLLLESPGSGECKVGCFTPWGPWGCDLSSLMLMTVRYLCNLVTCVIMYSVVVFFPNACWGIG